MGVAVSRDPGRGVHGVVRGGGSERVGRGQPGRRSKGHRASESRARGRLRHPSHLGRAGAEGVRPGRRAAETSAAGGRAGRELVWGPASTAAAPASAAGAPGGQSPPGTWGRRLKNVRTSHRVLQRRHGSGGASESRTGRVAGLRARAAVPPNPRELVQLTKHRTAAKAQARAPRRGTRRHRAHLRGHPATCAGSFHPDFQLRASSSQFQSLGGQIALSQTPSRVLAARQTAPVALHTSSSSHADPKLNAKNRSPPKRPMVRSEIMWDSSRPPTVASASATACPAMPPRQTASGVLLAASPTAATCERSPHSPTTVIKKAWSITGLRRRRGCTNASHSRVGSAGL